MSKTISFFNILFSEIYKSKDNIGIWSLFLFPIGIEFFIACIMYIKYTNSMINPWIVYGNYCFYLFSFLYPIIAAFAIFAFHNIEYHNNGYKRLFTLPVPKWKLYIAKSCISIIYMFISVLNAFIFYFLSGNLLGICCPDLAFQEYTVRDIVYPFFFKLFCSIICISSIQWVLSLIFSNFIVPVCIASFATIAGLLIQYWKYAEYYPYCNILISAYQYEETTILFPKYIIIALIYTAIFYIVGYFIFRRK